MISRSAKKWLAISISAVLLFAVSAGAVLAVGAARRNQRFARAHDLVGGDAMKGLAAVERYGCAACHIIPGYHERSGTTGPPLTSIGERSAIAGVLENTPENLVRWIVNPEAMDHQTAMPTLGVTESDARDIATYLYAAE